MNEQLQKAVSNTIEAGYQLDKEAFLLLETLSKSEDPVTLIEKVIKKIESLPQKTLFIGKKILEEAGTAPNSTQKIKEMKLEPQIPLSQPTQIFYDARKEAFKPYAKEVEAEIRVLDDPTDALCTTGVIEEYVEYFQDRFKRIQRFLRQRIDVKDAISISEALKSPTNSKIKIIGMIAEKRESKQRTFIHVEDMEADATILVPANINNALREKVQSLLLDQIICLSAIKGRDNLLILEDVYFPEIPQRTPRKASAPIYAALISDLHIGSKMFMREEFTRFVQWLNGKLGSPHFREIASHVKYVVIAGDLIDGIGIYPGQARELAIKDVRRQYNFASKFLEKIPDYIELIVIPGNHDASRKALPQPALPKDYAESIYEARPVLSLGNPSIVSLHNVEVLLYHGRSLDDVVAVVPGMSYNTPEKAMRLLLQCRHLAPVYGQRTPIAPEKRDFLVIERIPDIFHAGHVHVLKHDVYRGTLIVNSGAWQKQTAYMKRLGIIPVPGIVPIVNLQTLQVTTISFSERQQDI